MTSQAVSLTGRYINSLCYIVTGIAMFVAAASGASGWTIAVGLAAVGYGLYVGLTRGSYWVSTYTYLVPIVLIAVAFAH